MVIRGREAFLIKRQLLQRKQGRADPLVKLIGGNDIELLCGSGRKQVASHAPEAQPGLTVAGVRQAVWLGIIHVVLPGYPRPDGLVIGQLAFCGQRREIFTERDAAAALHARRHLFLNPYHNGKAEQEPQQNSEITARGKQGITYSHWVTSSSSAGVHMAANISGSMAAMFTPPQKILMT